MGFAPSPTTEDLASFLQGLPPGAHVAVNLAGLDMEVAMQISRRIADTRNERFVVIGHPSKDEVARSLSRALPLTGLASDNRATWVVVEAAASIDAGGAKEHARAEKAVGVDVSEKMTIVCFYTADAIKQVTAGKLHDLHSIVAVPGQV